VAPSGPGIRLDSGFEAGATITAHYDPMIAKLIVCGEDREEVLARLASALDEFWIAGIRTGLPFLRRLVETRAFQMGDYDTGFIGTEITTVPPPLEAEMLSLTLAAVGRRAALLENGEVSRFQLAMSKEELVEVEVLSSSNPIRVRVGGREIALEVVDAEPESPVEKIRHGKIEFRMTIVPRKNGGFDVGLRDRTLRVSCQAGGAGTQKS
jgi:acetyl/propionyl-CoA carboxylase alpha subunit